MTSPPPDLTNKRNDKKTTPSHLLPPFNAVSAAAVADVAVAILLALPSTFCTCVGDSLAANAFSVCSISTWLRAAGQSGRMGAWSCHRRRRSFADAEPEVEARTNPVNRGPGRASLATVDRTLRARVRVNRDRQRRRRWHHVAPRRETGKRTKIATRRARDNDPKASSRPTGR